MEFVLGDKVKEVERGRRSQGGGTGRVKEWKGGNEEVRRKKEKRGRGEGEENEKKKKKVL